MEFMLLLNGDEKVWDALAPEDQQRAHGAYAAYAQALKDGGHYVGGSQLAPAATATTVRVSADGKTTVLDGPYAETKEQLGGYYLIDVADLDAAISWAARCPASAHGTIEIRPLVRSSAEV